MLKKLFFSLTLITMVALVTSLAFGEGKNQYDITISKPGVAWQIAPDDPLGLFGDTWNIINANSAVSILVKIWNQNTNTMTEYTIPALGNTIHTIAVGDCELKVFDATGTQELVEKAVAYCSTRETPTLTQWGVIILVALIIASAIFIMVRRRRATVPA